MSGRVAAAPNGIAAGSDGALWFTNTTTTRSVGSPPPERLTTLHTRHLRPGGDRGRVRRGAVVHQPGYNSIGRITTTGVVTNYTGTGISAPSGSRPDRTAPCGSPTDQRLDRADHHQRDVVTNYTGRRHRSSPIGIAAGPDGALWFTNDGNDSIGRITTAGAVTNYTGTGISEPGGHRGGAGRRAVVHQLRQQLDRADHDRRGGHQLHRHRASRARRRSRRGRTARCGSPTTATTRSGGSPPPGAVTNYTGTGVASPDGIAAGPDGALWFTNSRQQLDRADHAPPGSSPTTPAPSIASPWEHRGRARRRRSGSPTLRRQLDRADHHGRGRHQLHATRASPPRRGSRPGPTARCGSPTTGNNSIGRITTAGVVTQLHRARASSSPDGIAAGPDGALWFTNHGNNSIGRITTAGSRHQLHRDRHLAPRGDHGRAGRRPVVHQLRLHRADHHRRSVHQLHRDRHLATAWDHRRTGRRPLVHQLRQQLDRSDHHRRGGHQLHRRTIRTLRDRAGADGALWFTNRGNSSIGRITGSGAVSTYSALGISTLGGIAPGPDGALWFTNRNTLVGTIGRITDQPTPKLSTTPSSGRPATLVRVNGSGYGAFESVTISYTDSRTGTRTLASVTTDVSGTFSKQVTIPGNATAGQKKITATGAISKIKSSATFKVT